MAKTKRHVIADTHFNSYTVANICNRPFKDIKQMNETLVGRWNHVIKENDIVYHLGDFADDCFSRLDDIKRLKEQLNGRIRIILGNHDRRVPYREWLNLGFDRVYDQPIVIDGFIILSHEPLFLNDLADSNAKAYLNIHGHVHGNVFSNSHYVNVCVDKTNFFPVNLDVLVKSSVEKIKRELEALQEGGGVFSRNRSGGQKQMTYLKKLYEDYHLFSVNDEVSKAFDFVYDKEKNSNDIICLPARELLASKFSSYIAGYLRAKEETT